MEEILTISRDAAQSKSQDYEFLRARGIEHIQRLAGKIWTDHNSHDPGITILEALCYAITDLGYRSSYDVADLVAPDPQDQSAREIKNFFTARQILPNAPVTINDYRKLMIDVAVHSEDPGCEYVGVKNAWIEQAVRNECPIYVHRQQSRLSLEPDPSYTPTSEAPTQSRLPLGILYDVLLEFEKCDTFGDLNESSLTRELLIDDHPLDRTLEGTVIKITVDFPRWDDPEVDFSVDSEVKWGIQSIDLQFLGEPPGYEFTATVEDQVVRLEGTRSSSGGLSDIPGITAIEQSINDFIYLGADSMLGFYRRKVAKIEAIIDQVRARLQANRNLCEDFLQFSALRVEKIAVCADIELDLEADVEVVQAQIYHEIAKFLSPTVYFYSLEEMLDKCKQQKVYTIARIDPASQLIRVGADLTGLLSEGDAINITNTTSNNRAFTVASLKLTDDEASTLITVEEELESEVLSGDEQLSFEYVEEDECLTIDEIFEGPALEHGFIDDLELEAADRRKVIHVSDLIQIIMAIDGVVAVRSIQIANIPQDDPGGTIPSRSVRWCLDLAFEQNYVPRLSQLDSKITYYKDQLPFKASSKEVEEMIEVLEDGERDPKLHDFQDDLPVPIGTYRDPESYESIQNDFPLTYGVGEEGLPQGSQVTAMRKAQTKQLKGFLLFFDQLLANYLSQLAHVKELFSMNAERDLSGDFVADRTYFTQSLLGNAPNAEPLYVDGAGHAVSLQNIAEDEELFGVRKNKFLDHLMARFAEQFTDYALLTFKISGELKAPEELIEDKLSFLNKYPKISADRGLGINQLDPCERWHIDNCSGLEQRVGLLVGVAEPKVASLEFHPQIKILPVVDGFEFTVEDNVATVLLRSAVVHETEESAKLAIESAILSGAVQGNFTPQTDDDTDWRFELFCDGELLVVSEKKDYADPKTDDQLAQDIEVLRLFFEEQYLGNVEANRKNLACPYTNYFQTSLSYDFEADPPTYTVHYELFGKAFDTDPANLLISGSYTYEGSTKSVADIISFNVGTDTVTVEGNVAGQLRAGDTLVVTNSNDNDGTYTVDNATNVGSNTEIVVNESFSSDTPPRGELRYNNESNVELQDRAAESVHEVMWKVIDNGRHVDSYRFDPSEAPFTSPYTFQLFDRGVLIGQSAASDFNDVLANEFNNLPSNEIEIAGSTGNDGTYGITSAAGRGPLIDLQLSPALPGSTPDGQVLLSESYTYEVDLVANRFMIDGDVSNLIMTGDQLAVTGSSSNDGIYDIERVAFDGVKTGIAVAQPIPAEENSGLVTYTKSFEITEVAGSQVTITGGYDDLAVGRMAEFFQSKFFQKEGLHVLEHILLRPKVKGAHFIDASNETLTDGLGDQGNLQYPRVLPIISLDAVNNTVVVASDLTGQLDTDPESALASAIELQGTGINDGLYELGQVDFDGGAGRTTLTVASSLIESIAEGTAGDSELVFLKTTPVSSVVPADLTIVVSNPEILDLPMGAEIAIVGSSDGTNDLKFRVAGVTDDGPTQQVEIGEVEQLIADDLLDIVLEEDQCDACEIDDPYTCIISVIIPHWQGRFDNMDFRRLMERRIRAEAPAHAFLNICWINCEQMGQFERAYKAWLLEKVRQPIQPGKLSAALNTLIDALKVMRNVYPGGTLHDCEEDDTLQNSIILDNSVLGNE